MPYYNICPECMGLIGVGHFPSCSHFVKRKKEMKDKDEPWYIPAYEKAFKGDGLDNLRSAYILETIRAHYNASGAHTDALPYLEQLIDALIEQKLEKK